MRAYRQKSSPNLGTLAILQRAGFLTQRLYLIAGRRTRRVARQVFTRAAIGSTLFRPPGSNKPVQ